MSHDDLAKTKRFTAGKTETPQKIEAGRVSRRGSEKLD
jgi:hypothetical protein